MLRDSLAAIRARRSQIETELADLRDEDLELAAAERGLQRLAGEKPNLRLSQSREAAPAPIKRGRKPIKGDKSQRELVLEILHDHDWLDLAGIVDAIDAKHGVKVAKRTLSPLLSALKREGLIDRRGRKLALARGHRSRRSVT